MARQPRPPRVYDELAMARELKAVGQDRVSQGQDRVSQEQRRDSRDYRQILFESLFQ